MVHVYYWQDDDGANTHVYAKMDRFDAVLAIYNIAKGLEMTKKDISDVVEVWDILTENEEDDNK